MRTQTRLVAHVIGDRGNTSIIYNASPDRETALAEAGVIPSAPRAIALSAMRSNRG